MIWLRCGSVYWKHEYGLLFINISGTEFATANCYVAAYEEVFSIETRTTFIKLNYYIEIDGLIIDSRRVGTITPLLTTLVPELAVVQSPSGQSYTFITDIATIMASTVSLSEVYKTVVVGTVVEQDYLQMEAAHYEAVIETSTTLTTTYDEVSVKIVGTEEMITITG